MKGFWHLIAPEQLSKQRFVVELQVLLTRTSVCATLMTALQVPMEWKIRQFH